MCMMLVALWLNSPSICTRSEDEGQIAAPGPERQTDKCRESWLLGAETPKGKCQREAGPDEENLNSD